MNAANEAAVQLFLEKKISFNDIYKTVNQAIETYNHVYELSIEEIIQIDLDTKKEVLSIG